MKKVLDLMNVAKALLEGNLDMELVRYIFKVQGCELKRLDFDAAAAVLKCDRRTVGRRVKYLSEERHVLHVEGDRLKINDEMLKDRAA